MIIIQSLTEEEAAELEAKFAKQKEERREYVAGKIKETAYNGLSIDEKKIKVSEIFNSFGINLDHPDARDVNDMPEADLNSVLVTAHDWEQACKEFDDFHQEQLARGPDAYKI